MKKPGDVLRAAALSSVAGWLVLTMIMPAPVASAGTEGAGASLWGTNGTVTAIARSGNTIYVGGSFTQVGPCTGSGVPLNGRTAAPLVSYPKVVGSISAAVPDGDGGWYIGGQFDHVGGLPRHNLAHILRGGDVAPWAPEPNGIVWALALHDGVVYAGGAFSSIGGRSRDLVAALGGESGRATDWDAHAQVAMPSEYNPHVSSIVIRGRTMYLGGVFSRMGGAACSNLAALELLTGAGTGWRPAVLGEVNAIAVDEAEVYIGGNFGLVDGAPRNGLAAVDRRTGALSAWNLSPVRPDFPWFQPPVVSGLVMHGSVLFVAGCFRTIGGQVRNGLAAIDSKTGGLLPWAPSPEGGSPYTYLDAIAVAHGTVYVGGYFASMGGEERRWLAAVDARTGAVLPWNPRPNSEVRVLAVSGDTIYAGGYFTMLGNWQSRYCLAALDATTGEAAGWDAHLQGLEVMAIVPCGSRVFVGGDFAVSGSRPRSFLAALDSVTAEPLDWSPQPNGPVWTLALSDSVLYAGGLFTRIDGQDRHRAAAMRFSDGTVTAWDPNADDAVTSLTLGPLGVYAGGFFGRIGGETRSHSAALDPASGVATPWDPAVHSWGWVNGIAIGGDTVYIGGYFVSVGGEPRNNLAAVDAVTGRVLPWRADADGVVEALATSAGRVFAGGLFRSVSGLSRSGLVAMEGADGSVSGWNPMTDADIWAVAPYDGTLYAGGNFGSVGYLPQTNIAAIPLPTAGIASVPPALRSQISASIEPNPSRTNAVVRFTTPTPGQVRLVFYDVQGRQITTILDREDIAARPREVHVCTAAWPPGTYFCRLEGPDYAVTRKLIVLK